MKILALAGSISSSSINRQLANYAASLVPNGEVTELDISHYELPIFSTDEEERSGVPEAAKSFLATIAEHDAVVISLAEHNGSYAAAFKNLYDWASRAEYAVWGNKPMLLMATSPGGRGGATVLAAAEATFPRMGADLKATFSLPDFGANFSATKGVTNSELKAELVQAVSAL